MALSPTARRVFGRIEHGITHGLHNPDQRIGVRARQLFRWAWLTIELADWLAHASGPVRAEIHSHFLGTRSSDEIATCLEQISDQLTGMLDLEDRRQQP
jgi:hypothetical protein